MRNPWAALCLDNAVVTFGMLVDAASQETIKTGPENKPEWKLRYRLSDLLTPGFKLDVVDEESGAEEFLAGVATVSGVLYDEVG